MTLPLASERTKFAVFPVETGSFSIFLPLPRFCRDNDRPDQALAGKFP
jgi:hypothetical protein